MSAECGLLSHRLQAKLAVTTGENMKLNEKLVSLRKAQKLNQAQAAEALNVSRPGHLHLGDRRSAPIRGQSESAQPPVSGPGGSFVE